MPRVSYAFFLAAVLYGVIGMTLGLAMGASGDHRLSPVHAHINLLGWVGLSLMGGFYALAGEGGPRRLAWLNFIVTNLGLLIMAPLLGVLLLVGEARVIPIMAVGEGLLLLGMVIFAAAILVAASRPGPRATLIDG